jgi:diguanylate cyclase (GGDEF)-like protein/PAS domain S-box-containing protein
MPHDTGSEHGADVQGAKPTSRVRGTRDQHATDERPDRSDAAYRALVHGTPEAVCVLDPESGRFVDVNEHALRLFGCDREHFLARTVADFSPRRQPDDRDSESAALAHVYAAMEGRPRVFEWWHLNRDGQPFPCEVSLAPLLHGSRPLLRGTLRDISQRKRDEQYQKDEHEILRAVAGAEPLTQTLERIALMVERHQADSLCTILLLEEDGQRVRHGAAPSLSESFRHAVDGLSIGPRAGACGTAMWRSETVVCEDIATDPLWEAYLPLAQSEGLAACWSMPILSGGGRVLGSFAVYYRRPRAPQPGELDLLQGMRHLAGIAIEHHNVSEALRRSEAMYRATFEEAAVGMAHFSPDGRFLRVNEKLCKILGYPAGALLRLSYRDITHTEDIQAAAENLDSLVSGRANAYGTRKRYRRADGTSVWVNLSEAAVRDGNGALMYTVSVIEDVSEAHKLSEELSYRARHDSVTGLVNRYEFERRLRGYLSDSRHNRSAAAVCYMDLDQFKLVNDTAGHVAGDALLKQLAAELAQQVPDADSLARVGGDEFALLLPDCSPERALLVTEQLRTAVAEFAFRWEEHSFRLGVSIGVVPLPTPTLHSVTDVMRAADAMCYAAKDEGRNRVIFWHEDHEARHRRHGEMQWAPRIARALDEGRFHLMAQPIVPVAADCGDTARYELLVRMEEDGETVPPGAFLPAAERYGLSPRIDRWVVERALDWLQKRPGTPGNQPLLSINLSGVTITDRGFRQFLFDRLTGASDIAARLCFEVTETAAIANLDDAVSLIQELRRLGCMFALDDFGSGLSSFAYLKNLPVDFVKIDGVFVRDVDRDDMDRAIVKSITELGRVSGKRTIAEFVESEAAMETLRELGVDYAQGFWIGRPAPLSEVAPD